MLYPSLGDRIKSIQISNLMVGRSPFRARTVAANVLRSQLSLSKFELVGEMLMENSEAGPET